MQERPPERSPDGRAPTTENGRRNTTSRRRFLAGATGVAGTVALSGFASAGTTDRHGVGSASRTTAGGQRASSTPTAESFEPIARLSVGGLKEAVVSDDGTTVYGATTDGFATMDVTDPANPRLLADENGIMSDHVSGTLQEIFDVKLDGDRLVVAGPANGRSDFKGFAIFDVSDPGNPERVTFYETGYGLHNVFFEDDVVYMTANIKYGAPTVMVDVSDDDPEVVGEWSPIDYGHLPQVNHDVYVQDGVLYACHWDLGTWLVDVSDPADPDAFLRVGYDLETNVDSSTNELPGNSHHARPNADATVLAVGKEAFEDPSTDVDGAPGGIELWDISDPENASREFVIAPPEPTDGKATGTAHNFGWRGDRLYVSWYAGGVSVYDVSDPANPRTLANWRDGEEASFWTAEPIHEGVVGASYAEPSASEDEGKNGPGLFTFPEPTGEGQPTRAFETLAPPASTTDLPEPTPTPTPTATPTPTPTPSPTPTATATPTAAPTETSTETATDPVSGPGFGVLTTVAAGAFAGWRLVVNRQDDE